MRTFANGPAILADPVALPNMSVWIHRIALALGSVARHEPITAASLGGALLVLAGLFIGMKPPRAPRT